VLWFSGVGCWCGSGGDVLWLDVGCSDVVEVLLWCMVMAVLFWYGMVVLGWVVWWWMVIWWCVAGWSCCRRVFHGGVFRWLCMVMAVCIGQ
jgi:hypothetical protein